MKIPNNEKPYAVITAPLRLSFMKLWEPELNDQSGKKEFSTVLLIPKTDNKANIDGKAEAKSLNEVITACAKEFFKGKLPDGWRNPLKDGDKETYSEGKKAGEAKHPGHWFMTVKSGEDYPPRIIGPDRVPLGKDSLDQKKMRWQSGDWGKAAINFSAYNTAGNKGVGAWLQVLQFVLKDEGFGGGASDEDFEDETATYAQDGIQEEVEKDIFEDE